MIGAGVFTTTGFLLRDLGSATAVVVAWAVGGVVALCGALAYAELAAALPRSGGEYALLGRIYHPALGFCAGVISLIVGFSAPMAASALALGEYLARLAPGLSPTGVGVAAIATLGSIHALRVSVGGAVQNVITAITALLCLALIAFGLGRADLGRLEPLGDPLVLRAIASPAFAVGLIYVSFAYSGWNAAAYIAGELDRPERSIPRALIAGTALVAAIYVGLAVVFVCAAPLADLAGVLEIGHVAAVHLFGAEPAAVVTVIVALGLLTTVSALMMAGPRVYEAMGADHPRLRALVRGRGRGGPAAAILVQAAIAAVLGVPASFAQLLAYMGLTLSLSAGLTVAGVFVLRRREPALARPYRTWGHPWTTLCALALMAWMIVHTIVDRPITAAIAAGTIALGLVGYRLVGAPRST
ncbi:MAG: amino acid permease [Nannocystaceae bacterium]